LLRVANATTSNGCRIASRIVVVGAPVVVVPISNPNTKSSKSSIVRRARDRPKRVGDAARAARDGA
jgi:hypothetical protein